MRGILFQFESFGALSLQLEGASEEQELELPTTEGLREGEWLLATIAVGDECTSIAACALDRGAGLRLAFAAHDWERLWRFARGEDRLSLLPGPARESMSQIEAPADIHVLVIDDDDDLQRVLGSMLGSAGFDVGAVSSAEEALDRLRLQPADLMVLEWNLPGMSGVELCRRLREDPKYARVPVVFLSARSSTRDVVEAFAAGADDFVSKPFRGPELGARILSLLRRAEMTSAG